MRPGLYRPHVPPRRFGGSQPEPRPLSLLGGNGPPPARVSGPARRRDGSGGRHGVLRRRRHDGGRQRLCGRARDPDAGGARAARERGGLVFGGKGARLLYVPLAEFYKGAVFERLYARGLRAFETRARERNRPARRGISAANACQRVRKPLPRPRPAKRTAGILRSAGSTRCPMCKDRRPAAAFANRGKCPAAFCPAVF